MQDSAVTIMDNDNKDLANLNSIDSQKLLSSLEYTPLKQVENNIDALDLSGEYSANQDLVASMQEAYKKFCDDGKTAFGLIKQDESLVTNQITALNTTMQAVDIVKDDTGTVVYQAGFDNVDSLLTTYNTNFSNQKDVIREKLGLTASGTSPTLLDNNVVQTEVDNSLSAISGRLTSSISTYNGTLSNQKTTINQKLEELKSDTDITSDDIDSIKTLVSDISTADASISSESIDMDSVLNTAFTNLMTEIDAMPSINTTQVKTIFDDEIMTSLSAEITAESNKIKTQADSTATELTTYTTRLAEFNPYTYYDETAINNHMNSFAGNISTIQEKSSETHTAYLDYVNDVYTATNENVTALQTNLADAYKGTTENVDARITQAKEERSEINEINISLLKDFSGKLPYTRLGELEYTQAYDFIVNPVITQDDTQMQTDFSLCKDITTAKYVYLGGIIIWLLCFGFVSIRKVLLRKEIRKA